LGRQGKYYYNKVERIWEGKGSTTTINWIEFGKAREVLLE
jgi:hypothetical protein